MGKMKKYTAKELQPFLRKGDFIGITEWAYFIVNSVDNSSFTIMYTQPPNYVLRYLKIQFDTIEYPYCTFYWIPQACIDIAERYQDILNIPELDYRSLPQQADI